MQLAAGRANASKPASRAKLAERRSHGLRPRAPTVSILSDRVKVLPLNDRRPAARWTHAAPPGKSCARESPPPRECLRSRAGRLSRRGRRRPELGQAQRPRNQSRAECACEPNACSCVRRHARSRTRPSRMHLIASQRHVARHPRRAVLPHELASARSSRKTQTLAASTPPTSWRARERGRACPLGPLMRIVRPFGDSRVESAAFAHSHAPARSLACSHPARGNVRNTKIARSSRWLADWLVALPKLGRPSLRKLDSLRGQVGISGALWWLRSGGSVRPARIMRAGFLSTLTAAADQHQLSAARALARRPRTARP